MSDDTPDDLEEIIMLGAGGHARVLVDLIRTLGGTVHGFVDADPDREERYLGRPVLGGDDELAGLRESGFEQVVVGVGMNRGRVQRRRLAEMCRDRGFAIPRLVHPESHLARDASVEEEAQLLPRSVVQSGATVGRGTIVNTGAIVEHDCCVGAYSHVATGAQLGGEVDVGACTCIGLGASVLPGAELGDRVSVGAGAVVVDDVESGATVVGEPARPLDERK